MTREEVKALLPVMQAWADGKAIETRYNNSEEAPWIEVETGAFNDTDRYDYRIKPELTYRPFKDAVECWQEMQKHQPFGWIQDKNYNGYKLLILSVNNDGVIVADYDNGTSLESFKALYLNYTFSDGEPFGVKEERCGV